MKKIVSLLLAILILMALTACGSSLDSSQLDEMLDKLSGIQATLEQFVNADEQEAIDETQSIDSENFDQVELVVASNFNETDSAGLLWAYFKDTLEDLTDGAVTLNIYYGGTLCSASEELGMVESGSIDMACLRSFPADLPLTTFPETTNLGVAETVEYYAYVFYENEASSQLLAEELAEHNAVYIGSCWAGGGQLIISTVDASSIEEFGNYACGATNFESAWKSLGWKNVNSSVLTSDVYTSLNSGLIQWQCLSIGPIVGMKLYEVTDYATIVGMYGAGNNMVMNVDTWTSLNEATQKAIQEAAQITMEYSVEVGLNDWEANLQLLEDNGVTISEFSQEDKDAFADALWTAACDTAYENCVAVGKGDDMAVVIGAASEFYGREWSVPET